MDINTVTDNPEIMAIVDSPADPRKRTTTHRSSDKLCPNTFVGDRFPIPEEDYPIMARCEESVFPHGYPSKSDYISTTETSRDIFVVTTVDKEVTEVSKRTKTASSLQVAF